MVRRGSRWRLGAASTVIGFALVLSACSSSSESTAESASPAASSANASEAPSAAPANDPNAVVTVGAAQGFPQLNPAIRTFTYEETLFPLLWSALTQTLEDGTTGPQLAESWTSNADATEWTFTLLPGATFSDGSPITAAEVKATLDYYLADDTVTQEANKLAAIEEVTAPDDSTVVFTLSEPNALLPESLVWVKIMKMSALDTINTAPVTSGPFTVASFSPDTSLEIVRRDDFWGPVAQVAGINFVKAPDTTAAVTSLRNGDIDLLWGTPLADAQSLGETEGLQLIKPAVPSQAFDWEMDVTSPPFDNVKARQALAYATDREAILQAAYYGQGTVSTANTLLGDANPARPADLQPYTYDLEKAKALFEEAGVTEGSTLIWWGVAGAYPEWTTAAEILQASLKEIGINLEIQNNEIGVWADKFYPAGKAYPGMIVPNLVSSPPEPAFMLNFLLSGRCECNWNNAEFDALFQQAVGTVDPVERLAVWGEAQALENQDVPLIVPLQIAQVAGASSKLSGVWMEGGGQLRLENVAAAS